MDSKKRNILINSLKLLLKLIVAGIALSYVLMNSDIEQIRGHILGGDMLSLIAAYITFNIVIILNGWRLNIYLADCGKEISLKYAVMISYTGAFFNLFLPGGVGGDGYIAYYLNRKRDLKIIQAIRIMLSSRLNGLFALGMLLSVLVFFSDFMSLIPYAEYIFGAFLFLQFPLYFIMSRLVFREKLPLLLRVSVPSFITQTLAIISALLIFHSLGIEDNIINYICLFNLGIIVSIIPISPGGIGLREFVFFKGSELLGLNPEVGVAISLVFFAIYSLTSLTGVAAYLRLGKMKPEIEKN